MLNGLNILLTSLTTLNWSDFKSILRTRLFIRRFCQTNGHFSRSGFSSNLSGLQVRGQFWTILTSLFEWRILHLDSASIAKS